jgi:hypothetical protein
MPISLNGMASGIKKKVIAPMNLIDIKASNKKSLAH